MANAQAMINEGLWRKDRDFQRLPRLAQCTFCQVLSQKDLDTAGVLTVHLELMAKGCDELTVEQLKADFAVLEAGRFLFVDYDTDELLVRSYVRLVSARSSTSKTNRAWLSVPKNARLIGSEKLRRELATELRRLRSKEADDLADEIDPPRTPLEPPPDPLRTLSVPPSILEGGPNPPSTRPVPVLVSRNVVGSVGENPRPQCNDHATNSPDPCIPCKKREAWDKAHPNYFAEIEAEERRRKAWARENCTRCHGENTYTDEAGVHPCQPHLPPIGEVAHA